MRACSSLGGEETVGTEKGLHAKIEGPKDGTVPGDYRAGMGGAS